ncbi:hypothetical protein [Starkeya nomas]|uniref:hypothetical protein n=1 Tax=Starkeya nomas TaxID=2666134 RepID=UPI00135B694C|nr:hypothetical protein [Starkeya nomas]
MDFIANSTGAMLPSAGLYRRFFQGGLGLHLRSFVTTTKPQPSLIHNLKSVPLVLTADTPRKPQSEAYSGPITLSGYERFKNVQDSLKEQGFSLPLPTGN